MEEKHLYRPSLKPFPVPPNKFHSLPGVLGYLKILTTLGLLQISAIDMSLAEYYRKQQQLFACLQTK